MAKADRDSFAGLGVSKLYRANLHHDRSLENVSYRFFASLQITLDYSFFLSTRGGEQELARFTCGGRKLFIKQFLGYRSSIELVAKDKLGNRVRNRRSNMRARVTGGGAGHVQQAHQ